MSYEGNSRRVAVYIPIEDRFKLVVRLGWQSQSLSDVFLSSRIDSAMTPDSTKRLQ
jgi:hypothetical protein